MAKLAFCPLCGVDLKISSHDPAVFREHVWGKNICSGTVHFAAQIICLSDRELDDCDTQSK